LADKFRDFSGQHGWKITEESLRHFLNQFPPNLRQDAENLVSTLNFLNRHRTSDLLRRAITSILSDTAKADGAIHVVPLAGTSAHVAMELLKQESWSELKGASIKLSLSIHEVLGIAQPGDRVVFVDDNIGTGTQFSAQILRWCGELKAAHSKPLREERGIELSPIDKNAKGLLSKVDVWLATCVGSSDSENAVKHNLRGSAVDFKGLRFGETLSAPKHNRPSAPLREFLCSVGSECVRHSRELENITKECRDNALGYGNKEGLTITLWNVPTSTYTALWSPAIVRGEPWCPLFIRRGYVEKLVVA
jgi:hypothetical protein